MATIIIKSTAAAGEHPVALPGGQPMRMKRYDVRAWIMEDAPISLRRQAGRSGKKGFNPKFLSKSGQKQDIISYFSMWYR